MSPTTALRGGRPVLRGVSPRFCRLPAAAITRTCHVERAACASSRSSLLGYREGPSICAATTGTISITTDNNRNCGSRSPFGRTPLLKRAASKEGLCSRVSFHPTCSLPFSGALDLKNKKAEGVFSGVAGAAPVMYARAFGGQSVVPWELALFLIEEMKGEMVQPGAVIYTAALAECRWAGEKRHVEYLLQEMEAEGLSIIPGIPGAKDDELPPSQAPPLFGKLPEAPPGMGSNDPQHTSINDSADASTEALRAAARAADTALATVETMWAREEHEPSPATCRAALDACAAGGQWERALSMVRDAAAVMVADVNADNVGHNGDGGGGGEEEEEAEERRSVSGRVEALALEGKWDEALLLVQGKVGLSVTT